MKQIPPHIFWPGAVVLLLLMSATMVTITVMAAVDDPSFAVDPDYYKEHIDWNARKERQRKSDALGWRVTLEVEPKAVSPGVHRVVVVLVDNAGKPVEGADVQAVCFHDARAHERESLGFSPGAEPGHYQALAHMNRDGVWEFEFTIRAGESLYIHTLKRTISGLV